VMASDISRGRLASLPWDCIESGIDPDEQLVAKGVRASMSTPFFYQPVPMKAKEERGKEITAWIVDGAMPSNFPVEVFDPTDGKHPRWPTFGMKLSARPESALKLRFETYRTISPRPWSAR